MKDSYGVSSLCPSGQLPATRGPGAAFLESPTSGRSRIAKRGFHIAYISVDPKPGSITGLTINS